MESLADESALDGLDEDPQALGRMMKKMGREMGEDLPPEFDDMAERLESGQSPDEIEAALPEMPDDMSSGLDDDL